MLQSGVKVQAAEVSYLLYSAIVPPSEDAYYTFQQAFLLAEHEPLCRQVFRLQRALPTFIPSSAPWKLICLQQWTQDYFFPVILLFEICKRDALVPYYSKLGHAIPEPLGYDKPEYLNHHIDNITQLTGRIALDLENEQLKDQLVEAINEFIKVLKAHWDAEERFWVDILSQHTIVRYYYHICLI